MQNIQQVLTDTNYIVANHSYYVDERLVKNMTSVESQLTKRLQFTKNIRYVHSFSTNKLQATITLV